MSIVALKRRAKLLNNQSGKDPSTRMLVRDGCECPPGNNTTTFSTGGGFSLNGKYRNIGRVGKNSLQSIGGSNMKPGTTNWNGSGGCCGGYEINPSPNNQCCLDDSNTVKPSTLNTRGMLANRFRWTKRNIPASNFTDNGAGEAPDNNQIQDIYNNWVSGENGNYNIKKSSQQYTENLAATLAYKNRNLNKDSGKVNCALDNNGKCSKGHHIGGKYVPAKPYAKLLNFTGTSSRAIEGAIAKRASLFPKGYDKPFPYDPQPNQCIPEANQGDDKNVLKSYYADENNTSVFGCLGKENGDGLPVTVGATGTTRNNDDIFNFNINPTFWRSPGTIMEKGEESNMLIIDINKHEEALAIGIPGFVKDDEPNYAGKAYYYRSLTDEPQLLTLGDEFSSKSIEPYSINNNGNILATSQDIYDDPLSVKILYYEKYNENPTVIEPDSGEYFLDGHDDFSSLFGGVAVRWSGVRRLNNSGDFVINSREGGVVQIADFGAAPLDRGSSKTAKYYKKVEESWVSINLPKDQSSTDSFVSSIGENNNAVGAIKEKGSDDFDPVYWGNITSDPEIIKVSKTLTNGVVWDSGKISSINSSNKMAGILATSLSNFFDGEAIFVAYEGPTSDAKKLIKPNLEDSDSLSIAFPSLIKIGENGDIITSYTIFSFPGIGQLPTGIKYKSFYYKDMNAEPEEYISPNSSDDSVLVSSFISKPK